MASDHREGLLGPSDNPNGDPIIEPLSKAPFDPHSPECLPFHLPDDLEHFAEWPGMVRTELERVITYVKGLGTMDKTGDGDIDFGSCLRSPELIGECLCGFLTSGAVANILLARTLTHYNGDKCEPTCLTLCVPFSFPLGCCCGPCYLGMKFGETRKQYSLKGSNQLDCLMHFPLCCIGCLAWGDVIMRQRLFPPLHSGEVALSESPAAPLINPAGAPLAAEAASAPPTQDIERAVE